MEFADACLAVAAASESIQQIEEKLSSLFLPPLGHSKRVQPLKQLFTALLPDVPVQVCFASLKSGLSTPYFEV